MDFFSDGVSDRLSQYAFSTLARDSGFVALTGTTLMVGFSFDPPLALMIGAQIALIFCLFLLYRVSALSAERLVRTEAWRGLAPHQRPRDEYGLARARQRLQHAMLHFAKGSSAIACVLLAGSLAAGALK